jgi:hypothetical protein
MSFKNSLEVSQKVQKINVVISILLRLQAAASVKHLLTMRLSKPLLFL